ncbi:MAG: DinB family protein [Anaerolineae bacterium]|nr:DinB family protein [Anaerolineae bacterium]
MPHPLVVQLRFTRSEFKRGLDGLTEDDACQRIMPMNCISWNIGHLAWQEQRYWLFRLQGKVLLPELNEKFCNGCPAFTPALNDMLTAWRAIIEAADPYLDTLTTDDFKKVLYVDDRPVNYTIGSLMYRMLYHYWYHTGENMAIRQSLGHTDLPQFVGNIDQEAPYQPH